MVEFINLELENINEWFIANKLSLNLDKTNYILFKSHRKSPPKEKLDIIINNTPLTQVGSSRFLGVNIDQHLTWKDHINEITKKILRMWE